MHMIRYTLAAAAAIAAAAPATGNAQTEGTTHPAATFVVRPAANKLPIPFHDPAFTRAQYDSMMTALYIINNFGVYQAGQTPETMYLHNGLDFVAPNGTKVFAVKSGRVKNVRDAPNGNGAIVIEDEDKPQYGWSYAHIDNPQVKAGDFVPAGTFIARVRFNGLDHTHVDRISFTSPDADWSVRGMGAREYRFSETFFDLPDKEPPVFADGPLYYFRNQSDERLESVEGTTPVISGDVDIVAAIRDRAPYARRTDNEALATDRLAVARVEYEIRSPDGKVTRRPSWDFSKIIASGFGSNRQLSEAQAVFKFTRAVIKDPAAQWWKSGHSYYMLTNVPEGGAAGVVDVATYGPNAWRTAEVDERGKPRWPNGTYSITVRAWDAAGNTSIKTDTVLIKN